MKQGEDDRDSLSQCHLAHDVGEDGTRGTNESTHDSHEVVVEHEALSTQRPARVAVQHCDHHGHVRTCGGRKRERSDVVLDRETPTHRLIDIQTDRDRQAETLTSNSHGECDAHDGREGGGGAQHGQANVERGVHHVPAHGADVSCQQASVEGVSAGQQQWGRVEEALQLPVGHQGATEGDATNVSAEEQGSLDGVGSGVRGKVGEVVEICRDAGQHCSSSHQAVCGQVVVVMHRNCKLHKRVKREQPHSPHLWKAATSCGRSVISIFLAMVVPMAPPRAAAPPICINTGVAGVRAPMVDAMPPDTPICGRDNNQTEGCNLTIPSVLPSLQVDWLERPPRAPTQHSEAARVTAGGCGSIASQEHCRWDAIQVGVLRGICGPGGGGTGQLRWPVFECIT
ncbi:hypothetical protein E2C01_028117 [Portunus trituberculatus]|uniref:Uncharacterized protein n=1 Tax=Portunus trituberculatus TaxID=210409 RepID=A0A5B7EN66_PORTR|nr:hypothetical protein [Portunus trituberculatus]